MDLKVLAQAKNYIDDLAHGINPLTQEMIPDSDIVNNVKISQCLFYVRDCLEELLKEKQKSVKLLPFTIGESKLRDFQYSMEAITLSEIINRINMLKDELCEKLKYKVFSEWLISIGVLEVLIENGKKVKRPTNLGKSIGIVTEQRYSFSSNTYYIMVLFEKTAQEFIIDNFGDFLEYLKKETK